MGEGVGVDGALAILAPGLSGAGEVDGCVGVGADAGVATVWPNLLAGVLAGLGAGSDGLSMGVNVRVGVRLTRVLPACVGESRSGPMIFGTAVGSSAFVTPICASPPRSPAAQPVNRANIMNKATDLMGSISQILSDLAV